MCVCRYMHFVFFSLIDIVMYYKTVLQYINNRRIAVSWYCYCWYCGRRIAHCIVFYRIVSYRELPCSSHPSADKLRNLFVIWRIKLQQFKSHDSLILLMKLWADGKNWRWPMNLHECVQKFFHWDEQLKRKLKCSWKLWKKKHQLCSHVETKHLVFTGLALKWEEH